jgi:uncharacterized protein
VIATNLAVMTEEMIGFFCDHDIHISTSLDGPMELHNKNRPRPGHDSYERAIKGIKLVRRRLGRDRVSALMTTTNASLSRVRDIIDEYVALEFPGIFLRPLSPYGFAVKTKSFAAYNAERWLEFYKEGLAYILELNQNGIPFQEHYASLILKKMLTSADPGYVDLISPAGIGIGAVVYNYDGRVFASDESRMLAEMGDESFCIGNVHKNSYEEIFLHDRLLGAIDDSFAMSVPMCSDCAFEPYCGADPVYHHGQYGDVVAHKTESEFCKRNMSIFKHLIVLMEDDTRVKSLFYRWANS